MRNLPQPFRDEEADLDRTIERRAPEASSKLEEARDAILDAYDRYESVVLHGEDPPKLTLAALKVLRENYALLGPNRPLSDLRSQITKLGVRDRCPYCGCSRAAEIDHYLPQSRFPHYSIMARNLVPVCSRCNRKKSDIGSVTATRRFFHPYFDHLPGGQFVTVDVEVDCTVYLNYQLSFHADVPRSIRDMIDYTFNHLHLIEAFTREAYNEVSNLSTAMAVRHEVGGRAALQNYLLELRDSYRANYGPNHWASALHGGLAASTDFCDGGYRILVPGLGNT